ncbi:hypothetical protein EDC01DRAFT_659496 [Geopyxis carbonaria]|nr:hypothetical protein EDC01DRAFT_659496 [Geopyxis carbonaria]
MISPPARNVSCQPEPSFSSTQLSLQAVRRANRSLFNTLVVQYQYLPFKSQSYFQSRALFNTTQTHIIMRTSSIFVVLAAVAAGVVSAAPVAVPEGCTIGVTGSASQCENFMEEQAENTQKAELEAEKARWDAAMDAMPSKDGCNAFLNWLGGCK